jgi:WhiB family redox-sensing transcriptional regulator
VSDLAALLDELAIAPNLPGARCVGKHATFDLTAEGSATGTAGRTEVETARIEALDICAGCPELGPCAAWVSKLPPKLRPQGVVAGQVIERRTRPRTKQPDRRTA